MLDTDYGSLTREYRQGTCLEGVLFVADGYLILCSCCRAAWYCSGLSRLKVLFHIAVTLSTKGPAVPVAQVL